MNHQTQFKAINPVIPVRDMQRAVVFYEDKLGFRKAFDNAPMLGEKYDYAGVCRGGLCLHLQTMSPEESPTMPLIRIHVEHIAFLYEEYNAQGLVGPNGHLEAKPWGSKDFGIYDLKDAALVFYEDL